MPLLSPRQHARQPICDTPLPRLAGLEQQLGVAQYCGIVRLPRSLVWSYKITLTVYVDLQNLLYVQSLSLFESRGGHPRTAGLA